MKDLISIIENLTSTSHREENVDSTERFFSAIGGGYLLYSAWTGKHAKLIKGSAAAMLLYRAFTGHCPTYSAMGKHSLSDHAQNINIRMTMVVRKPRSEVYAYWRKLEQLPLFMKHLVSVKEIDSLRSQWIAKIPGLPGSINWQAEIVKEELNEFLGWSSLPGSVIENAGKIEFTDASINSTEINAIISYRAPLGTAGEKIARLLSPVFKRMVEEDLKNFKEVIEIDSVSRLFGNEEIGRAHV